MDTQRNDEQPAQVRCVVVRGFKYGRNLLGPGQEIDLPREGEEGFDRLHGLGVVRLAQEVAAERRDDLAEKLALFCEVRRREPNDNERRQVERHTLESLRAELLVWAKAQEEWQKASDAREAQRLAREQAQADKRAAELDKAAQRARARGRQ